MKFIGVFLFFAANIFCVERAFVDGIEYYYEKPEGKGPFPCVFLIHGYQFPETSTGGKVFYDYGFLTEISKMGIVAVAVSVPGFGNSIGIRDFSGQTSQDGVIKVLDHFKKFDYVDDSKIGIYGISRGATIASMVAVRYENLAFQILQSGIYDFKNWHIPNHCKEIKDNYFEESKGNSYDRSAIEHVDKITIPTLFVHGQLDVIGGLNSAIAFHEGILNNQVYSRLLIFPNLTHFLRKICLTYVLPFLNEQFFNRYTIGIQVVDPNPYPQIESFLIDYPADKSPQLCLGDVIIAISPNNDEEMIDAYGMKPNELYELLIGEKGSKLRLKVSHIDETEEEIVIERSI